MARLSRYLLDGTFPHVTARATGGIQLYVDDEDRLEFRQTLKTTIPLFDWKCPAWCLMGAHYHALVEATLEALSGGMHRLNSRYARWFNDRHNWRGRLFADRFSSFVIEDEAHLHVACEYILQNPVRAACAARPPTGPGAASAPPP
jgi:REP element-mobilizing transposase RayT